MNFTTSRTYHTARAPAGLPGRYRQVALTLLTPAPEADFEAWAIHRRAFDIAVNSLAPA